MPGTRILKRNNIFCLCQILWSYILVMTTSIKISSRAYLLASRHPRGNAGPQNKISVIWRTAKQNFTSSGNRSYNAMVTSLWPKVIPESLSCHLYCKISLKYLFVKTRQRNIFSISVNQPEFGNSTPKKHTENLQLTHTSTAELSCWQKQPTVAGIRSLLSAALTLFKCWYIKFQTENDYFFFTALKYQNPHALPLSS